MLALYDYDLLSNCTKALRACLNLALVTHEDSPLSNEQGDSYDDEEASRAIDESLHMLLNDWVHGHKVKRIKYTWSVTLGKTKR